MLKKLTTEQIKALEHELALVNECIARNNDEAKKAEKLTKKPQSQKPILSLEEYVLQRLQQWADAAILNLQMRNKSAV